MSKFYGFAAMTGGNSGMTEGSPIMDEIVTFMGVPVNEMPRDELEREFCKAWQEIERLQKRISQLSVNHVHDLATFKRHELQEKHPFLNWLNKYL